MCMGKSSICGVKCVMANSRALVVVGQYSLTPLCDKQKGTEWPLLMHMQHEEECPCRV